MPSRKTCFPMDKSIEEPRYSWETCLAVPCWGLSVKRKRLRRSKIYLRWTFWLCFKLLPFFACFGWPTCTQYVLDGQHAGRFNPPNCCPYGKSQIHYEAIEIMVIKKITPSSGNMQIPPHASPTVCLQDNDPPPLEKRLWYYVILAYLSYSQISADLLSYYPKS